MVQTLWILKLLHLASAIALVWFSFNLRNPWLATLRVELFIVVILVGFILLSTHWLAAKKRWLNYLILGITSFSLLNVGVSEASFQYNKHKILTQNNPLVTELGQHFIVGYHDFEEVTQLVRQQAIAGIFLTTRNIQGKTKTEIQQEIKIWQQIRSQQKRPPLWIASDQEGGIVSRLSPPLTKLPLLAKVVNQNPEFTARKKAVIEYATQQAQELAELGINLNFAPVVDLNKGVINPEDRLSQIYRRAISSDKQAVTQVASWYCQTLKEYGVKCTIKHFPGLGRVEQDTHISEATLSTPVAELAADDWVPFRELMAKTPAFTMLGHVKITKLDAQNPVSFSPVIIQEILRQDWRSDGVLITDDFCMRAVYGSKLGVKKATVQALNSGVDLILIAYDPPLYYSLMSEVMKAFKTGTLEQSKLEESKKRLQAAVF